MIGYIKIYEKIKYNKEIRWLSLYEYRCCKKKKIDR